MRNMMFDTIQVTVASMAEPFLKTPEEAIRFSKSINRTRIPPGISSCMGQKINSTGWSDDAISLHLESGKTLRFRYAKNAVDLTIRDDVSSSVARESLSQEIQLIFPSGEETRWERGKLIEALEGNAIHHIQATQSSFFVYVTNVEILWIYFLIDRSSGHPFLYWGLTD
jgi:hypothetical protein